MPYEIKSTPERIEATWSAPDRESFFREAIAAGLSALYGDAPTPTERRGDLVPIQAAGDSVGSTLSALVKDLVLAAHATSGTLCPPRWLSFDERRVTAALPVGLPPVEPREVEVEAAGATGSWPGDVTGHVVLGLVPVATHR